MRERDKYFTVAEANQLIPELEEYISQLKALREKLEALGTELSPLFEVIRHNGGHRKTPDFLQQVQQFQQVVERIKSTGGLLKDIEHGLVDFPHIRDGREVYLCWRSGETEIRYWHEVDTGAAGRQLL
jgi:hypothetical protein